MAWVKLDDAMPHHPKVMAAGPQAFALDVAGICYSNKHATDGFIAEASLPAVLPSLPNPKKWAEKLVEVGRWRRSDGGWEIAKDFHEFDLRDHIALERARVTTAVRARIIERDGPWCVICGWPHKPEGAQDGKGLEIDHMLALARGGTSDDDNLTVLCAPCNREKGVRDIDSFMIERWFPAKAGR